jgi:Phage integrase, N-terminal SAM-like domain
VEGFKHIVADWTPTPPLITVSRLARQLQASQSWVRRHQHELPVVRIGRLVRFDPALFQSKFRGKEVSGSRLRTGATMSLQRYQRGYVYRRGKKKKVWYAMFREDVRKPDGKIVRQQRNVRLGTMAELPTKNAADAKLSELLSRPRSDVEMTFKELAERWKRAEGPTMKASTFQHYQSALRAYVVPFLGGENITAINREKVQRLLAEQAAK